MNILIRRLQSQESYTAYLIQRMGYLILLSRISRTQGISRQIFTIDAWKENRIHLADIGRSLLLFENICQRLARHIATRKGCFSLTVEQETRCHEPSAFYSNVEYSNDPRDGIIGSNDRAWNPLATPSSGQCVCLHPRNLFTEQSMNWYVAGRRNRCLFDGARNGGTSRGKLYWLSLYLYVWRRVNFLIYTWRVLYVDSS